MGIFNESSCGILPPAFKTDPQYRSRFLTDLASEISGLFDALAQGGSSPGSAPMAMLNRLKSERRLRAKFFPKIVCQGPAWPMLLELYANNFAQREVTVTGLVYAVDIPVATGRRWIEILRKCDLIFTFPNRSDARSTIVEMTDDATHKMGGYIQAVAALC